MLLEDALAGLELVRRVGGPIVDVGSGGGTPGIPLAVSLPDREVTLLEAERRKAEFLEGWTSELANLRVVWGRAESQATDRYRVAVAKALAQPPGRRRVVPPARLRGWRRRPLGGADRRRGRRFPCRRADRRRAGRVTAGVPRAAQGRPDTGRVPAPAGDGEEAAAGLSQAAGSAFRSRMPLNSRLEATISFQSGQRFSSARNSIPASSCSRTRPPSGATSSGSTVARLIQ